MQMKKKLLGAFSVLLILAITIPFVGGVSYAQDTTLPYKDTILADNPSAYWRLGELSGNTAIDEKGTYNGTHAEGPLLGQTGAISYDSNTAIAYNGTSSYTVIPYNSNLNPQIFSIEAWAYRTGSSDYGGVVGSRDYPYGWIIYAQPESVGSRWSFWINDGSGMVEINGPAITENQWTHLAATFDGTTAQFYVNGQLAGSKIINTYIPNTTNEFIIGKGQAWQPYYFNGKVDDVSFYSRALTSTTIANHYKAAKNNPQTTVTPTPSVSPSVNPTPSPTPMPSTAPDTLAWGKPAVTFTFDDGYASARTLVAPELNQRNMPATFNVNTRPANDSYTGYMSWAQIQELQNSYGFEVASHAYEHVDLSTLTASAAENQLTRAISDLQSHGIDPVSFASPYGGFNTTVNNDIARLYASHRTSWNILNVWPIPAYDLRAITVTNTTTVPQLKSWIDSAVANNEWLIINYHNIVTGTPNSQYEFNLANFIEVVDYIKQKNVAVADVRSVVNSWGTGQNLISNGSFELGTTTEASDWVRSSNDVTLLTNNTGSYPNPTRSMRINTVTPQNLRTGITSSKFAIDASKLYRLKAFVRVTDYTAGSTLFQIKEYTANNTLIGTQTIGAVNGNQMGNIYLNYTPTPNTARIELLIYNNELAELITQVDALEIKQQ